jgi:putative ABC transport system substrate-binding protein
MGALLNPNATDMDGSVNELEIAARSLRVELRVLKGGTERQIDEAFAGLMQQRLDALYVANDPFLSGQSDRIISHAARLGLPTINGGRGFAAAGGLISYGPSIPDAYHQAGVYVARILKCEKPSDLPVVQSVKLDLVINLKTAKALGVAIPPGVFAIADEIIE